MSFFTTLQLYDSVLLHMMSFFYIFVKYLHHILQVILNVWVTFYEGTVKIHDLCAKTFAQHPSSGQQNAMLQTCFLSK